MLTRFVFRSIWLLGFFIVLAGGSSTNAQQRSPKDANAEPIAAFNLQCTSNVLPNRLLKPVRARIKRHKTPFHYQGDGKSAIAYDLNGDGRKEYFVMLGDEGFGDNIAWGIFSARPFRFLGTFVGDNVYIRRRVSGWSALTVSKHLSVSDSFITTFAYRKGRYIRVSAGNEVSARRNDAPEFMGTTPSLCDSGQSPQPEL